MAALHLCDVGVSRIEYKTAACFVICSVVVLWFAALAASLVLFARWRVIAGQIRFAGQGHLLILLCLILQMAVKKPVPLSGLGQNEIGMCSIIFLQGENSRLPVVRRHTQGKGKSIAGTLE